MSSQSTPNTRQPTLIAPLLSVRRGSAAIDFYKAAFGAEEVFRVMSEDGQVVARLRVDGAEFWLADESPEHANFSPETLRGGTVRMLLMVEDPDVSFQCAVSAGASVVSAVVEQHGWLIGRVVDPFGHHWEICRELGGTPCAGPEAGP